MKKTVNQIRVELNDIATAHDQINDFFWGDWLRAIKERKAEYPLMVTWFPTGQFLNNQTEIQFAIVLADKIYKKWEENLNDVESDMMQVARDVFNVMNQSARWQRIGRVESCTLRKFIDATPDEVAGVEMTVNFRLREYSGICGLPMTDYDFDENSTYPTCQDATYTILDDAGNTLYSGSIASGGSLSQVIQDSTAVLKDTAGTTISTTSINAENTEDIVAPDTDIEVNGVSEGSVVAGSTVDVQLVNTTPNTISPLSVTQSGADFTVELDDITYDIYVNGVLSTSTSLPYGENNTLNISWI